MTTSSLIIGRDDELRILDGLLAGAAAGPGSALLIHGAAGLGKSALLRAAGATAADQGFTVLNTAGVETERWFPFAALHLLLQPLGREATNLPVEAEADVYRIGLAVLELLADAADRQPVLVLADDLQWIDKSSRDVLRFVARRTVNHRLLMVGASRLTDAEWDGPGLFLGPLGPTAAEQLLDTGAPELPAATRALILDRAAGNPLALVELPKAVGDGPAEPDGLPLTRRLESAFAARTGSADPAGRALLLALAAEPTTPLDRLLTAAGHITRTTVNADAIQPGLDAGLVTLAGTRLEFRHPLMRSAIYKSATVPERLAVHRALAVVLADSPERRLAHEAAATIGPDDGLADQLEAFADASLARGKMAAALPALRRAGELAADARRRTGLLIRAAEVASLLSDRGLSRALLDRADLNTLGPVERARLLIVSDNAGLESDDKHRRIRDMVSASGAAMEAGAPDVAENLLWRAGTRCFFLDGDALTRAAVTAQLAKWDPDPRTPHLVTVRAYAEPYRFGLDVLPRFDAAEPDPADGRGLHFLGSGAMVLGEFTRASRYLAQAATIWRAQGQLGLLSRTLAGSWPRFYLGQLGRARADADEGLQLADETGETVASHGLRATVGLIAVARGDFEAATAIIRELRSSRLFAAMPFATVIAQQTDGLLALFEGRPDEAYRLFAQAFEPTDVHHHSVSYWMLAPDLADAAVAAGKTDEARQLLADLPGLAAQLPSEMMRMADLYTRAVLAPDDEAEQRYAEALDQLPAGLLLVRARLQLHHGRWLRRHRRYLDARNPLRAARDEFDRIGALPWAEMARSQLRATGETAANRDPHLSESLSAREMQIAELAARGLSNREIGQRLFISHRTVSSYLYRIYPRLGISGRGQLAGALAAAS
ncbi:AAA family ATPase [Actinoplanes sp. TRM 88003]|uniref:AAA family ATPase n=1 Tax=Paractinoplanes aksuensis TaxID=2939490 RepID=A0ABT1DHQ3_9ACTN|nr:LuxR family transcriptional regulator [Actinoplanes aksuensis]MCO8270357.1 AAA family ATPase [Actinoplanes aksuensis]